MRSHADMYARLVGLPSSPSSSSPSSSSPTSCDALGIEWLGCGGGWIRAWMDGRMDGWVQRSAERRWEERWHPSDASSLRAPQQGGCTPPPPPRTHTHTHPPLSPCLSTSTLFHFIPNFSMSLKANRPTDVKTGRHRILHPIYHNFSSCLACPSLLQ